MGEDLAAQGKGYGGLTMHLGGVIDRQGDIPWANRQA
jgi:hypothetical protein